MPPAQNPSTAQISQVGMVNPPRKAKRLRELVSREHIADPILPNSPLTQPAQPVQPAQIPPAASPAPRPRGRKPAGPMSRAAREQLRKTNHSVIEKRRREKINEALAALRDLVPNERPDGDEKEFKLEVLVRTVEYLRMMVTKVRNLEEQMCVRCGNSLAPVEASSPIKKEDTGVSTGKRKRPTHDDIPADESISDDDGAAVDVQSTTMHMPASSGLQSPASPHSFPQLPSISSWLLASPVTSPILDSHLFQRPSPPHPFQLPSPPQSTPFAPTNSTCFLPRLSLPPGLQLPTSPGIHARKDSSSLFDRDVPDLPLERCQAESRGSICRTNGDRRTSGASTAPWTRDDQTAASLLLNISSRRPGETRRARDVVLEAQTPSSVLGMADGQ